MADQICGHWLLRSCGAPVDAVSLQLRAFLSDILNKANKKLFPLAIEDSSRKYNPNCDWFYH